MAQLGFDVHIRCKTHFYTNTVLIRRANVARARCQGQGDEEDVCLLILQKKTSEFFHFSHRWSCAGSICQQPTTFCKNCRQWDSIAWPAGANATLVHPSTFLMIKLIHNIYKLSILRGTESQQPILHCYLKTLYNTWLL